MPLAHLRFPSVLRLLTSVLGTTSTLFSPAELSAAPDARAVPPARPNILLILLDDAGYSDVGCYGGEIPTPHIDRLARNGVRFARFYNAAQCCPTRAALLSGLYPHQAGMGDMNAVGATDPFWPRFNNPSYTGFKQRGIALLPEVLASAGYQTFISGKWHVGDKPDNWPSVRGFQRSYSLIIGAHDHFSSRPAWRTAGPLAPFIIDGQRVETLPEYSYSTDAFTDATLRFIDEAKPGQPWFTYLAYTAPHWPIQAPEEDIARYRGKYVAGPAAIRAARAERQRALGLLPADAPLPGLEAGVTEASATAKTEQWLDWMETYAAMMDRVDRNIGRLVAHLEARGQLHNTLILFLSDNGADEIRGPLWAQVSNAPFRAQKVWTYEGGIATPLIAHWPAGIPAAQNGRLLPGYGHVIDLQPTCLAAAGASQPSEYNGAPVLPLAGIDLLPALRGESPLPADRPLFWERQGNEAVRRGDWKLVRAYNDGQPSGSPDGTGPRTGQWQLFNLAEDPGETRDRLAEFPRLADELHTLHRAWSADVGVIPREIIRGALPKAAVKNH